MGTKVQTANLANAVLTFQELVSAFVIERGVRQADPDGRQYKTIGGKTWAVLMAVVYNGQIVDPGSEGDYTVPAADTILMAEAIPADSKILLIYFQPVLT